MWMVILPKRVIYLILTVFIWSFSIPPLAFVGVVTNNRIMLLYNTFTAILAGYVQYNKHGFVGDNTNQG
jgi:hypothetical protein